ncbi:hypothetical protein K4K54_007336 [Colletotrichum sp. SAR 10_86]|nr:hypothetical protein K4K54_007336 [Colletotrichum sp. SAR 10_86]
MNQHTIIVHNQADASCAYFLIIKAPSVNPSINGDHQVDSYVYAAAPCLPPGAEARFAMTQEYFAVCGSVSDQGLVQVTTLDWEPAKICHGSEPGSSFYTTNPEGGAQFDRVLTNENFHTEGGFCIKTGTFKVHDKRPALSIAREEARWETFGLAESLDA